MPFYFSWHINTNLSVADDFTGRKVKKRKAEPRTYGARGSATRIIHNSPGGGRFDGSIRSTVGRAARLDRGGG